LDGSKGQIVSNQNPKILKSAGTSKKPRPKNPKKYGERKQRSSRKRSQGMKNYCASTDRAGIVYSPANKTPDPE
jgi:hypothetical protein